MSPLVTGIIAGVLISWGVSLVCVAMLEWLAGRALRRLVIRQARELAAARVQETEEAASRVLAALAVQRATGRSVYVPKPHQLVNMSPGAN